METVAATAAPTDRVEFLRWAFADFRRFCGLLQIQPKEGQGRIPMRLSRIQKMYNARRTDRDIVLKPRQIYMTTLEAARDLWWFLTRPGARVVLVCQSQTDMAALKDISEKFRIFFDSLRQLGIDLKFGRETATDWTLPEQDGSLRIIQSGASEAAASKKGRGGTINRLHISEAAFFEQAESTFNSLLESVPRTGAEIVVESTPNGAAGFYFEQWRAAVEGKSAFTPHFFPWWEHPEYRMPVDSDEPFEPGTKLEKTLFDKGVPIECLQWYRWKVQSKGGNALLVAQEFPSDPDSCFLLTGRGFFDAEKLQEALAGVDTHPPLESHTIRAAGAYGQIIKGVEIPAVRIFHRPERGRRYVLTLDTSEGTGGDAGAGILYERGTGRHMATLWGQFKPWELARAAVPLAKLYFNAEIIVERNNHGHACLRALEFEQQYRWIFRDRDEKPGWLTNEVSRTNALDALEHAHRGGHFVTHDPFLLSEMRTFVVSEGGRPEAAKGAHDDLVMAAAIGWDGICRPLPKGIDPNSIPVA